MSKYEMELNSSEKALIQNALINLKFTLDSDAETAERLDELLERVQTMRPNSCYSYDAR